MASFFTDLFEGLTGQQATPQQNILGTEDTLRNAYGAASALAPSVIAYNQSLAPGLMGVQLGVEKQYDPYAAQLRSATSKSILDELGMGSNLGAELQDQVIRNALEGNAATGFGVGAGGRGLVARDLGLTGLQLGAQRRAEALGAVRSQPSLASLYQPDRGVGPGAIAADLRDVQAQQDEYANLKEDIRRQNFASLINTGGRIAGTVAGSIFGGGAGAQIGGQIGGSLYTGSRVAGQQKQGGGDGGFTSILSGLGGMFRGGRPGNTGYTGVNAGSGVATPGATGL